ncbi:MAG: 3-oxoacid CoA-transferase subunit B [Myxococcota bacterium]|nr:3-oxoacid CoA-transferase subunit B [Myxococcota bacterium]
MTWSRTDIARQALSEIIPWSVVNLGIGLPTLVGDLLPADAPVWLQSENGILGMGPYPKAGAEDAQLINAGKQTVTVRDGGSLFDSVTSFAMIRGGHVDLALLGALQVSAGGDLANWSVPGGRTMGIGGAMDLAAGAKRVVVLTRHMARDGVSKLRTDCSYPLTAVGVVDRVITDLGIFEPSDGGFSVIRLAPGVSLSVAAAATDAPLHDRRGISSSAP